MKRIRLPKKFLLFVFAAIVLGYLVVHETGMFTERIGPENPPPREVERAQPWTGETADVRVEEVRELRAAIGTLAPRRLVGVSPRVSASVIELAPAEGELVAAGDLIARLDERDLAARVSAAEAAHAAARARVEVAGAELARTKAERQRAGSELGRTERLLEGRASTQRELERAQAADRAAAAAVGAAEASVEAARAAAEAAGKGVEGARIALGWAEIRAPQAGVIADRPTEEGELASPGKPLVLIYDPSTLRLEAAVPEGDAHLVSPGAYVQVEVPAADLLLEAQIEEIEPMADPASRTVLVKVSVPAGIGLRAGQYGRLRYVIGSREVLSVPAAAVSRTGQVELVRVLGDEDRPIARHVRTAGPLEGGRVEVLTGLAEGERVALEALR